MGNSWQSPVTGEPSFGTPKWHYAELVNTDPSDTNWHSISLSSFGCPVGTKGVFVTGYVQDTAGADRQLQMSNEDGGTVFLVANTHGSTPGHLAGFLPVGTDRLIWYKVTSADVDGVQIYQLVYFC